MLFLGSFGQLSIFLYLVLFFFWGGGGVGGIGEYKFFGFKLSNLIYTIK